MSVPRVNKRLDEMSGKYPNKLNPSIHPPADQSIKILFWNGPDFNRQYHPAQYKSLANTLFDMFPFYTDGVAYL